MNPRRPGRGHSACLERSGPPHYNGDMIDAIITFSIRHRAIVIGAGLVLALLERSRRGKLRSTRFRTCRRTR